MTRLILALSLALPMAACRTDGAVTWADGGDSPLVTSDDPDGSVAPADAPLLTTPAVGTAAPGEAPGQARWFAHGGQGHGDDTTARGGHGGGVQLDIGGSHPSTSELGSGPTGVEFWSTGALQVPDATPPAPTSHAGQGVWRLSGDVTATVTAELPTEEGPQAAVVAGELFRRVEGAWERVDELEIPAGHTLTVVPDAGTASSGLRLPGALHVAGDLVFAGGMNRIDVQAAQVHVSGAVTFLGDGDDALLTLHGRQADGIPGDVVVTGSIHTPKAADGSSPLYGHAGSLQLQADGDLFLTGTLDLTAGLHDGEEAYLPGSRGMGGTASLTAVGQLRLSGAIHTQGCGGTSPFDVGDSGDVVLRAGMLRMGGLVDTHGLDALADGTDAGHAGSVDITVDHGGFLLGGTFDLQGGSAASLSEGSGGDAGHLDLHVVPSAAPDPETVVFTDLTVGADLFLQGGDAGAFGAGGDAGSLWVELRSTQMTSPPLLRFVGYPEIDLRGADGSRGGDAGDVQVTIDHAQARPLAYAPGWYSDAAFLLSGGGEGGSGGDLRIHTLQDDARADYPTIVRGRVDLSQGWGDAAGGAPGELVLRNGTAVELRAPVVLHSRGADDGRHERPFGRVDIAVPHGTVLLAHRIFGLPPETTGNGRPGCEVAVVAEQIAARGSVECPGGDGASGGDGGAVVLQSSAEPTRVDDMTWDVSPGEGPDGRGRDGRVEVDGEAL